MSKRVASERQVVSLTHTWSGMSLLALDSMGSLHFITLIRPSDIGGYLGGWIRPQHSYEMEMMLIELFLSPFNLYVEMLERDTFVNCNFTIKSFLPIRYFNGIIKNDYMYNESLEVKENGSNMFGPV